jgi:hypothetical protein
VRIRGNPLCHVCMTREVRFWQWVKLARDWAFATLIAAAVALLIRVMFGGST